MCVVRKLVGATECRSLWTEKLRACRRLQGRNDELWNVAILLTEKERKLIYGCRSMG